MATTLTSSDKFIANSAVTAFVRRGVKLVALDFDQTIVDIHTGGAWRGLSSTLVPHVRPCFKALIEATLAEPRLHVCVVTFSTQPGMIEDVLKAALPNCDTNRILIRGVSKSWMPHSSMYDPTASFLGKEEHLARITTDLYNIRHAIIQSHEIVLIDDDVENVEVARRFGHFAFEVKPNVTVSDIAEFAESLLQEKLPVACYVKSTEGNDTLGLVASAQSSQCIVGQQQSVQRRAVSAYNMDGGANQELSGAALHPQRTHSIHFVLVNGTYHAI